MSLTDADIARAQALGRLAARTGQPLTSCPYPSTGADSRVLRTRWALAHAGVAASITALDR